jgi:hypothetical protein
LRGTDILVGGQARAFWVQRFGVAVPQRVAAISDDADLLAVDGDARRSVERFAWAGRRCFPVRMR